MTSADPVRVADDVLDDVLADLVIAPSPRHHVLTNWRALAEAGEHDLDCARLAEAHLDAATITDDLGGAVVEAGSLWGVWAARSSSTALRATHENGVWYLNGSKPWCSGADRCTHALVTADTPEGGRLFAVDLRASDGVRSADPWRGVGMRGCGTATVGFTATPARTVGEPGAYLDRPGFWHTAIGVAVAWFGGAVGAAAPLRERLAAGKGDEHDAAHLGRVDVALGAAATVLRAAAGEVADPSAAIEAVPVARRRALRVRLTVEQTVDTVLRSTARATGPYPLAHDAHHARHVADLEVFVRQSHAERDLATLGRLAAGCDDTAADGPLL